MTARRSISTKERARLFALHGGRCHICGWKIDGTCERWEVEHVIPFAYSRDDSDENRKPAHINCHAVKTADDRTDIAKVERMRLKHTGADVPRSPLARSRFKKRMDGTVVDRKTGERV